MFIYYYLPIFTTTYPYLYIYYYLFIYTITYLYLYLGMPGLVSRRLKTQGWWTSNTALLTFDDVKVPEENIIGEVGQGFLPIMHQFNKERFMGIVSTTR